MLHLHEPLAPGATMTACLTKPAPLVGTFHAAGTSASYRYLNPVVRWMANRLDVRCVVSDDARALAEDHLGGTYLDSVQRHRGRPLRQRRAVAEDRPHDHVPRPPRAPEGPRRPARRPARAAAGPPGVDLRRRARHRPPPPAPRRRSPARVDRPGERRGEAPPPPRRRRVLRALAPRRVVRHRAARGHGRRTRSSSPATCRATAGSLGPTSTALLVPPGRRRRSSPPPSTARSPTTRCAPGSWPRAGSGRTASRWTASPTATSGSSSRCRRRADARRAGSAAVPASRRSATCAPRTSLVTVSEHGRSRVTPR